MGVAGPDEKILWSSVPDMAIIISVGTRVTRGRNWSFFNENLVNITVMMMMTMVMMMMMMVVVVLLLLLWYCCCC